ncbi:MULTISPECIES: hypothetical protein [Virgibacillus]|uniref:hypothetical protein n=1 Tax=Virgibacillus TaxID=84406 RepID=UPI001C375C11|nr:MULTISPECIES: hypothetical protein [Virgibacillus]
MLLTAIYHFLKKKEPYNPELYQKSLETITQIRNKKIGNKVGMQQPTYTLQKKYTYYSPNETNQIVFIKFKISSNHPLEILRN